MMEYPASQYPDQKSCPRVPPLLEVNEQHCKDRQHPPAKEKSRHEGEDEKHVWHEQEGTPGKSPDSSQIRLSAPWHISLPPLCTIVSSSDRVKLTEFRESDHTGTLCLDSRLAKLIRGNGRSAGRFSEISVGVCFGIADLLGRYFKADDIAGFQRIRDIRRDLVSSYVQQQLD